MMRGQAEPASLGAGTQVYDVVLPESRPGDAALAIGFIGNAPVLGLAAPPGPGRDVRQWPPVGLWDSLPALPGVEKKVGVTESVCNYNYVDIM